MLGELIIDPFHFRLLHGGGRGRLGDLLLPRAGLDQGKRRPPAAELGLDRLEFRLGVLQLVLRARAAGGEAVEPSQPALGIGEPGLKASDRSPSLFDLFLSRTSDEFGQNLPPPVELRNSPLPLDFQQPPQEPCDRLSFRHMLPVDDREIDQPPVNGAPNVAGSRRNDRAHEGLPGGKWHCRRPPRCHGHRPLRRLGKDIQPDHPGGECREKMCFSPTRPSAANRKPFHAYGYISADGCRWLTRHQSREFPGFSGLFFPPLDGREEVS